MQVANNGHIMVPVVHSHTMILFHMTPTPDAVRVLPLPGPPSPPTETTTSLDSLPPGSRPLLALGCHFNLVFPLTNFPHRGFFRGYVGHMS